EQVGIVSLVIDYEVIARDDRRRNRAVGVLRIRHPVLPFQISVQVVAQQAVRAEVNVDTLAVRGRSGCGGTTDFVDFLDGVGRDRAAPQHLSCSAVDAQRGELTIGLIELGEENPPLPNRGGREPGCDRGLPANLLSGAELDRRFAGSESRGVRPSELRPPFSADVLGRGADARQSGGHYTRDLRGAFHGLLLVRFSYRLDGIEWGSVGRIVGQVRSETPVSFHFQDSKLNY